MNVTGVGVRSSLVVQSLGDMRTQLGDLQRQLGTGKKSTTYAGLGIDRGLAVGLRSRLSAIGELRRNRHAGRRAHQPAAGRRSAGSPTSAASVKSATLDRSSSSTRAGRPRRSAPRTRSSTRSSACSIRRPATATCSPAARSTSRRPTRSITSSTATCSRAGFKQVMAERKQADLGASGLGRLTLPAITSAAATLVGTGRDHRAGCRRDRRRHAEPRRRVYLGRRNAARSTAPISRSVPATTSRRSWRRSTRPPRWRRPASPRPRRAGCSR